MTGCSPLTWSPAFTSRCVAAGFTRGLCSRSSQEFGDASAPAVCAELKIRSQNDRALLDEAKHRTYLKGFTEGVMLVGAHAGQAVRECKPVIRATLIAAGDALPYCEPETPVVSRRRVSSGWPVA